MQEAERMGGIDINEVKAGALGPLHRLEMPFADVADVLHIHASRLHRIIGEGGDRQMRRAHRHFAGIKVRAVHAVIGQLDPGQRPALMDLVHHARERRNIAVIPQAQLDERCDFRGVVKLHLLGADHTPAAFRLHAAHVCKRSRIAIPHAIAMGHLIKAVARRNGTDLHRLEKNVVLARPLLRRAPFHPITHGCLPAFSILTIRDA